MDRTLETLKKPNPMGSLFSVLKSVLVFLIFTHNASGQACALFEGPASFKETETLGTALVEKDSFLVLGLNPEVELDFLSIYFGTKESIQTVSEEALRRVSRPLRPREEPEVWKVLVAMQSTIDQLREDISLHQADLGIQAAAKLERLKLVEAKLESLLELLGDQKTDDGDIAKSQKSIRQTTVWFENELESLLERNTASWEQIIKVPRNLESNRLYTVPINGSDQSIVVRFDFSVHRLVTTRPEMFRKFLQAISSGVVGPKGQQGIKFLKTASTRRLFEIKILGEGGDYRLVGNLRDGVFVIERGPISHENVVRWLELQ